jgi:hypothetical protein
MAEDRCAGDDGCGADDDGPTSAIMDPRNRWRPEDDARGASDDARCAGDDG